MRVGVPTEVKNHEYRVAITPAGVHELTRHGHDVLVDGMDPARSDETHQMQGRAALEDARYRVAQHGVVEEAAVGNGGGDARQVLKDPKARTQVEMPDLAVAHLAGRKADCLARRLQPAMRPLVDEPVPVPHRRAQQRVARRIVVEAEAVQDDEDDGQAAASAA